jgi:hypothetical protein
MAEVPAGSGFYEATIPVAALESGSLEVRWICRGAPFVVKVGQIVLYDPSGQITDARTGAPISGATVILYRVPGALPDTAGQRRNCRTVNTRGGSDWSKVPDAPIDAGVMVNPQLGVVNATQEISPTINPQITNANGRYGWDVAEGCWYIVVRAQGYVTRTSPIVGVPPAVTDLDIRLTQSPRAVYLPLIVR